MYVHNYIDFFFNCGEWVYLLGHPVKQEYAGLNPHEDLNGCHNTY
jgi:hypothetical protein